MLSPSWEHGCVLPADSRGRESRATWSAADSDEYDASAWRGRAKRCTDQAGLITLGKVIGRSADGRTAAPDRGEGCRVAGLQADALRKSLRWQPLPCGAAGHEEVSRLNVMAALRRRSPEVPSIAGSDVHICSIRTAVGIRSARSLRAIRSFPLMLEQAVLRLAFESRFSRGVGR